MRTAALLTLASTRMLYSIFVLLACVSLAAQPASPRAVDGHPDLQGVWNFSTITPLERPAEFADREFLTDAEAAQYEARTVQRNNRDNREQSADADVSAAPCGPRTAPLPRR